MKTDLGRYASRAKKYGAAKVDLDPLLNWYRPTAAAAFSVGSQTIHISLDAARTGKTGGSERHEFIHAVSEHYCRDLGGNSAFYGDIRALDGVDLFPEDQGGYNKGFSLEENVTYAYEVWWAGREVKGLCDQFESDDVYDLDQFTADIKASFQELYARELLRPGQRIARKSFLVGAGLEKLLGESERQLPTASFSRSGSVAYLDYTSDGSKTLGLDFYLVPTRTGKDVLRAICRNAREGVSMEAQITDPDAIRAVSNVLKSGDQQYATRVLDMVARGYVRPRITATTDAAHDLRKAHDGLYAALKHAGSLMKEISPQRLANVGYREQLFGSLDAVFAANRTLRTGFRKHSRA